MVLTPAQADGGERSTARLYRASLGEASAKAYLPGFARFDERGMAGPTWNSAAALFHLGWLVHHRLWLSLAGCSALAAGVALAVLGLWQWVPGLPMGVKLGASLAAALGVMLVPGLWGTAWLHTRTRRRMIAAVERAATVDGACVALSAEARDRQRRNTWGLAGLLSAGVLAALLWQTVPWSTLGGEDGAAMPTPEMAVAVAVVEPGPSAPLSPVSRPASDKASAVSAASSVSPGEAADDAPAAPATSHTPDLVLDPASAKALQAAQDMAGSAKPIDPPAPAKTAQPPVAAERASAAREPASILPKQAVQTPSAGAQSTSVPARQPATNAVAAAAASTGVRTRVKGYGVAVGMFSVIENAERVATRLSGAGLPVLSDPVDSARGRLTRVRVGPFEQREQAEAAAARIKALGLEARIYAP